MSKVPSSIIINNLEVTQFHNASAVLISQKVFD